MPTSTFSVRVGTMTREEYVEWRAANGYAPDPPQPEMQTYSIRIVNAQPQE